MSRLKIYHLDVGQGDCTLILYFDDNSEPAYSVLLDCGENFAHIRVIDILRENEFARLNTILLTHYDSDHFSGVIKLLELAGRRTEIEARKLLSGTQIWDPGIPGAIQEKNFFDNYLLAVEKLTALHRKAGQPVVHRVTGNLLGNLQKSTGDFEDFTLAEFDGWTGDSFVLQQPKHPWFVPTREIRTKTSSRVTRLRGLYKNRAWPIEMDVVNYGRGLAQITDDTDDFPEQIPLPLSISIIVGNGRGVTNRSDVDDPLDAIVANNNVPQLWRDRIANEAGSRITKIASSKDENRLGMGYLLQFENFRYWFGGDLTSAEEDALTDRIGKLSVLKAGHHGSHHSTSIRFLAETQPAAVTISTASDWNDTVQLPHVATLERINDCPSVKSVFLTGMPILDDIRPDFIPGPEDLYDVNRKFQVAGTSRARSSEILLLITSEEAQQEKPVCSILYREANTRSPWKRKRDENDDGGERVHKKVRTE